MCIRDRPGRGGTDRWRQSLPRVLQDCAAGCKADPDLFNDFQFHNALAGLHFSEDGAPLFGKADAGAGAVQFGDG